MVTLEISFTAHTGELGSAQKDLENILNDHNGTLESVNSLNYKAKVPDDAKDEVIAKIDETQYFGPVLEV